MNTVKNMVPSCALTEGLVIQHKVFVATFATKWGFAWFRNDAFIIQCSRIVVCFYYFSPDVNIQLKSDCVLNVFSQQIQRWLWITTWNSTTESPSRCQVSYLHAAKLYSLCDRDILVRLPIFLFTFSFCHSSTETQTYGLWNVRWVL